MDSLVRPHILRKKKVVHSELLNLCEPRNLIEDAKKDFTTYTSQADIDSLISSLSEHVQCDTSNILMAMNAIHLILTTYPSQNIGMSITSDIEICSSFCQVTYMDTPLNVDIYYAANPDYVYGKNIVGLEQWAQQYPNTLFVIDESYVDYTGESVIPIALKYNNILIMRSFTRTFGVAFELNYIIGRKEMIDQLSILNTSIPRLFILQASALLQNVDVYMAAMSQTIKEVNELGAEIQKTLFEDGAVYGCIVSKCPWIILQCKDTGVICDAFNNNAAHICDLNKTLPGYVRIAYFTNVRGMILNIVKRSNFLYDTIIFGLESIRKSILIKKKISTLPNKYIISNDPTPNEQIKDELKMDCKIISPITLAMNPRDREWFVYDDVVYIVRYPNINDYHFLSMINKYKKIRVVEKTYSISSAISGKIPELHLPFIGAAIEYIQHTMQDIQCEVIGKETLKLEVEGKKVLVVGDMFDKTFAKNNNYDFYEAQNIDTLTEVIGYLAQVV